MVGKRDKSASKRITVEQGGLRSCLSDHFDSKEKTKIVGIVGAMSRRVRKLQYFAPRVMDELIKMSADDRLTEWGYIRPPDPGLSEDDPAFFEDIWLLNGVIEDQDQLPIEPLDPDEEPSQLSLDGVHAMDPFSDNCYQTIMLPMTKPGAANAQRLVDRFWHEHWLQDQLLQQNDEVSVDFSDFHAQPENDGIKGWNELTNDLSRKMEAEHLLDLRINFRKNLNKLLSTVGDTMLRGQLNGTELKDLVKRTAAYLSPRFLLHDPNIHTSDSSLFLPSHPQELRERWISALLPFIRLLQYILKEDDNRVIKITAFQAGEIDDLPDLGSIYNAAQTKHDWAAVLKTKSLATRAFPFLRFAGMYLNELQSAGAGAGGEEAAEGSTPKAKTSIKLCPYPTNHQTPFVHYSWRTFSRFIVLPCLRDSVRRDGSIRSPAIDADKFRIPHPTLAHTEYLPSSSAGDAEYQEGNMRAMMDKMFQPVFRIGAKKGRNQFRGASYYRKCDVDVPIRAIQFSSNGTVANFTPELAPSGNLPEDEKQFLLQDRIPTSEGIRFMPRHLPIPHPDSTYPGTEHTGSLFPIQKAPLFNVDMLEGREVIAIDPGQRNHIYGTRRDLKQILQDRQRDRADADPDELDAIQARFREQWKDAQFAVTGKHTRQRNGSEWQANRWSAKCKTNVTAAEEAGEEVNINDRINVLKGLQRAVHGATISSTALYVQLEAANFTPIYTFLNDNKWSTRGRFQSRRMAQHYKARLAQYASGKIGLAEFLEEGLSPKLSAKDAVDSNRDPVKWETHRQEMRQLPEHKLDNFPVIAFEDGARQASGGRGGVTSISLMREMAIQGSTVIQVRAKGTSQYTPNSFLTEEELEDFAEQAAEPDAEPEVQRLAKVECKTYCAADPEEHQSTRRRKIRRSHEAGRHALREMYVCESDGSFVRRSEPGVQLETGRFRRLYALDAVTHADGFRDVDGNPLPLQPIDLPENLRLKPEAVNEGGNGENSDDEEAEEERQVYALVAHDAGNSMAIRFAFQYWIRNGRVPRWNGHEHLPRNRPAAMRNYVPPDSETRWSWIRRRPP